MKKGRLTYFSVLVLAGCITAGNNQWAARIGHYTLEQAMLELGPPQRSAQLKDGVVVAEWINKLDGNVKPGGPNQEWPTHFHNGAAGASAPAGFPACHLRLTFAPDEILIGWKMYSR